MSESNRWPRNTRRRRARNRLLRIVALTLALVFANALSTWSMAAVPNAGTHAAAHCHDMPAKKSAHAGSCPCCDHACQCVHASGAPVPEFAGLPAVMPANAAVAGDRESPPFVAADEHLRPPIG